jgi:tetratricopeptide (TPR) repeat protein
MQAPEETEEQRIRKADAYIRAADALFMTRKFELCIEPYSQGIQMNKSDVDYALYQRALCYGLLKKYNEKIADLQQLEKKFPNSPYYLNGLLEMANTLNENKKDPEQALVIYQKILEKEPGTRIRLECYARMGNIYYARKEDDKALVYFDKFLKNDTHSEEAKNIMEQVKAIYKAKGDIAGMEKYFVSLGQPLEENQLEKAAYEDARETYYEKKDFIAALEKWKQYIQRFPNGKNYLEAQYCAGVILYDQKKYEEALPYLQYVTQQARSIYSEDALNKLAFIYYDKKKDYPNALNAYLRLRSVAEQPSVIHTARWGVLRSAYYASSCDTALQMSNEILAAEKLTQPDLNAVKYIRLICMYKTGKYDDFIMESKNFPEQVNSVQGAEILFYKATIFKVKKNYTECKSTIKQILRYSYTNESWKNQTMLLLADIYMETEQFNDAQIALETLLESNPSPEFRQKAEEALKKLQGLREQKIKAETRSDNNKMNNILSEDNE